MDISLPQAVDRQLAEFLRNNEIITFEQFGDAEKAVNGSDSGIVNYLLKNSVVNEDEISDRFANFYGMKKVRITNDMLLKRPLQEEVNDDFIKKNRVIPFRDEGESISVVISDPTALNNVNNVKALAGGKSIETLVTNISSFEGYLGSLGQGGGAPAAGQAPQPQEPVQQAQNEIQVRKKDLLKPPTGDEHSGSDVINFVDFVIEKAVSIGASDIHLEIYRYEARLRMRRDGVLQEIEESKDFLNSNYSAAITRIKILADLDISERRLPQDGNIAYTMEEKTIDLRVSVLPTAYGERVVMRILDPESANFTLDELGIDAHILEKMRKAIHSPQGMVLVTGPTGSGKSTTLYAVLKELNHVGVNILTAEDPVEFDLQGVGQVAVKEKIGLGFKEALKSFLRQDPEVIMVGEIRDKDTSDIAIKAALTGHLVLSTLHTNDAPSTITRMVNMGIPSYLITAALQLVVGQRLARVICKECKIDDTAHTPEEFIKLGFSEEESKTLKPQMGKGCDACMNTGIKGRKGIYEILEVTDPIRQVITKGATDIDIKEAAQKEGFVTMQEVGRKLVIDGTISVEEFKRILILD